MIKFRIVGWKTGLLATECEAATLLSFHLPFVPLISELSTRVKFIKLFTIVLLLLAFLLLFTIAHQTLRNSYGFTTLSGRQRQIAILQ